MSSVPTPVDEPAAPAVQWGIRHVLLGIAVAYVASGVAVEIWTAVLQGGTPRDTLGRRIAGMLGLWLGFLGVPWWVSRTSGSSLTKELGVRFRLPHDAAVGIPFGIFCQTVVVWLVYLPVQLFDPQRLENLSDPAEAFTALASGPAVILLGLVVVLIGPFVEEVFFRGVALRAFAGRFGVPAGVIGSGVLFGLIHFEPLQTPALIVLGILLAWVTTRTGRLGAAVFGHMAFNAVTFVALVAS